MLDRGDLPLDGLLVLDLSQFLAGPVAALRLADLGARVVKIERPVTGEIGRTLAFGGRWRDGDTMSFHAMNRNKEAVVADLKDPEDLALVKELVARADVLVQNFRPGVMRRLGLDHESVRELNPGLVYASASGYGAEGPWASRPGQDLLAQAVSALAWASSTGEHPVPVGLALADHLMSCHLAQGVTALLVRKARTGRGGLVETSLLEAVLDLQLERLTSRLNADPSASGGAGAATHPARPAPYGVYPTADGHLSLAMVPLDVLGRVLEVPELGALVDPDDGWTQRDRIEQLVAARLAQEGTRHWEQLLGAAGADQAWCAPVLGLEELLEHEAFRALQMTQEVRRAPAGPGAEPTVLTTVRSPLRIDGERLLDSRAAPRLGEQGHVRERRVVGGRRDPLG